MIVDERLLLAFLVTTAIAMIVPGPDMLFVFGCGLRGGPRAGLMATCGVATSEIIHVAVAAAGLAALFEAAPTAFVVVRVAGALYLMYLGIQLIRKRGDTVDLDSAGTTVSTKRAYLTGMMTNLLNPKMVTFTIAFLPQFVDPSRGNLWAQFAILGVVLVTLELIVDGTVGVLAGRIGGWLRRRRNFQRRADTATGFLFIGLGVRLALARSAP